jgi:hypothetical protein
MLAPNTSISLQTSAAEAHLAQGHSLLDEQTTNKAKSLAYRTRNSKINRFRNIIPLDILKRLFNRINISNAKFSLSVYTY